MDLNVSKWPKAPDAPRECGHCGSVTTEKLRTHTTDALLPITSVGFLVFIHGASAQTHFWAANPPSAHGRLPATNSGYGVSVSRLN
jgi:hypothetical protein